MSQMGTYFYSSKYHKNRCSFLSLKWVPNFIAPNLRKIGVHAYLHAYMSHPQTLLDGEDVTKIYKPGKSKPHEHVECMNVLNVTPQF